MTDPKPLLLTRDEAVAAFWFLLKMLGQHGRAKLRNQMKSVPADVATGERQLLIRAIDQFEADLDASLRQRIVIAGPQRMAGSSPSRFRSTILLSRSYRDMIGEGRMTEQLDPENIAALKKAGEDLTRNFEEMADDMLSFADSMRNASEALEKFFKKARELMETLECEDD
jgi:hypothetical protein